MRSIVLIGFTSLLMAACTGPAGPDGPVDPNANGNEVGPSHPDYETFDPSGYDAQPRPRVRVIEHDVPDRLMEGRVDIPRDDSPEARTVEGYRIQIFSSEDRNAADLVLREAMAWWRSRGANADTDADLEPTIAYIQPYYRVRLGGFEFRQEAEELLEEVRQQYRDAFIVPDLVTIRD
ncbi:MAG: SPOR domain-containing protein [Rubricoccaceae bacterium]|nr:SPOR domain-containing protein [Rubricoccaceae bacterium]